MGDTPNSMTSPSPTSAGGIGTMSAADSYAATSANMAGSGSAVSPSLGQQGGTAGSVGQSAIGSGTVGGSMNAAKMSRWKENLKMGLGGIAEAKLSDLNSLSQFNSNIPMSDSYNESALQPGSKNAALYKQLIDQETMFNNNERIRRYNMGRAI